MDKHQNLLLATPTPEQYTKFFHQLLDVPVRVSFTIRVLVDAAVGDGKLYVELPTMAPWEFSPWIVGVRKKLAEVGGLSLGRECLSGGFLVIDCVWHGAEALATLGRMTTA